MLHQELPEIASSPLDGSERWLLPALGAAALLSIAAFWLLFGQTAALVVAGLAAAGGIAGALALRPDAPAPPPDELDQAPDYGLVGAALALCEEPAAITSARVTAVSSISRRFRAFEPTAFT